MLPCLRVRDAAFFLIAHPIVEGVDGALGAAGEYFTALVDMGSAFTVVEVVAPHVVDFFIGEAILEPLGHHHIPGYDNVISTTHVKTLRCTIKHKLMGENADLVFVAAPGRQVNTAIETPPDDFYGADAEVSPTVTTPAVLPSTAAQKSFLHSVQKFVSSAPGWFCPYLHSTHRQPIIPRTVLSTTSIISCTGPFLLGDYLFAQNLLANIRTIVPLCTPDPSVDMPEGIRRVVVTCIGLSPFRGLWTLGRRPHEGILDVQLMDGVAGVVVPVNMNTPLVSWSTTTMQELVKENGTQARQMEVENVISFLETFVAWDHVQLDQRAFGDVEASMANLSLGGRKAKVISVLRNALGMVMDGIAATKGNKEVEKKVETDRAGVVVLRYGNRSMFAPPTKKR
ncbi:hypothetical protein HDV00_003518 [Rhizophlyctis rosea]|nr:hypothetical protein HDV00_003518 [Rhizophlyctis rosea]